MLAPQVTDNGIVKSVAARFGTVRHDDLAEGEHRDIGHARADVHNHGAVGLVHGQTCAQRRRQRTVEQLRAPHACVKHGGNQRALFHLVDGSGQSQNGAGAGKHMLADGLEHKALKHEADQLVIGDGTLAQGADGQDIARRASDHTLGLVTKGKNIAAVAIDGHHGGLAQNDALSLHIDQDLRSAQINPDVADACHSLKLLFHLQSRAQQRKRARP